jgi:hypothetical protein
VAAAIACIWTIDAPTPASAAVEAPYFSAGFEHGLAGFNLAGVGEVVPRVFHGAARSGASSCKFTLQGSEERSELILGGGRPGEHGEIDYHDGQEVWLGFSFKILKMVYGHPGAHNLIMQFKGEGDGSPALGLSLWDVNGRRGFYSAGDAMDHERFLAPAPERRWHDVAIGIGASNSDSGFYRVYLDGQLVDERSGVSTIPPGRDSAYIKLGLYRNARELQGTSALLIDSVALGQTRESVQPGP